MNNNLSQTLLEAGNWKSNMEQARNIKTKEGTLSPEQSYICRTVFTSLSFTLGKFVIFALDWVWSVQRLFLSINFPWYQDESGDKLSVNLTSLAQCIIQDMEKCELELIVNSRNLDQAAILPDYVFIIITVIYSIIFVCGIVGNTLVIYVVSRYN